VSNILVSVIVPTFRRPDLLEKAIDSVIGQTYSYLEIIIVDDNDPNSLYRQLTELKFGNHSDKRVKYVKHEQNKGANVARNTGFTHSTGEYIAFLDDDDEYLEDKIQIQLEVALKHKNVNGVLIFVGAEIIRENTSRFSSWMNKRQRVEVFEAKEVFYSNFIGSNSFVLIDRCSFEKVNGYDESLPSCQDWDLWIRLTKVNIKLIGISLPLVKYHERMEIARITNDSTKKVFGHLEILKNHIEYLNVQDFETIKFFYRYLYYQMLPIDRKNAVKILKMQFIQKNVLKDYCLLSVDIMMLYIVKIPLLYNFFRKIKHM
jgi:glycosyltransferase involved in cell wall biosynthesis